jgi:serine/threonine protein kinase
MEYRLNIKNNNNLINLDECKKKIYDRSIFLGKGGQGSVYKIESSTCGGVVLKVYHKKTDEKQIYREINILDRVKKIIDDNICPNFLYYYDFFKTNENNNTNINILMEYADGDLEKWVRESHTELEWQSFIFQFISGVHTIQKYLKGFHSDLKPKNIFFIKIKKTNSECFEYTINTKTYYLPNTGYLFLLADYGHFQSLFFDDNDMTQEDIQSAIRENQDFDFIKDFSKRIEVTNLLKKYNLSELNNKFRDNDKYQSYYKKQLDIINKEMKNYPNHVKEKFTNRNLLYFCLEENLINYEDEIKNGLNQEQIPPIKSIKDFLESVLSEKENIDKLFEKYFSDFTKKTDDMKIIAKFNMNLL